MARRKRRASGRSQATKPLQLTSMMDILTVLLLFLLKSFVVEGEVITPVPGVDLPQSSSDAAPVASLVVAIFDDSILLDGQLVTRVAQGVEPDEMLLPDLAAGLDRARAKEAEIAQLRGDTITPDTRIAIQGDREIPFEILQRVMFTCNQSGYQDISLAVIGAS